MIVKIISETVAKKWDKCYFYYNMSKFDKILLRILTGRSDNNILFSELCYVLDKYGFQKRIKGDHHIYYHVKIIEIVNIQPIGSKAKPYQVKQIRNIILKYKLEV